MWFNVPLDTKQVISETFLGMEKTKPNATKARTHQSKEMYYTHTHTRLTALFPGLPR